jgi:hypothetical protein
MDLTPTGMAARTRSTAASRSRPMRITSPPSRMAMAMPIASLPAEMHLAADRVDEAAVHARHVAQAEVAAVGADAEVGDGLDRSRTRR